MSNKKSTKSKLKTIKAKLGEFSSKVIAWRLIMHLPVGLAVIFLTLVHPIFGSALLLSFVSYEISQDWRKKDCGYLDIAGLCWGVGLGGIAVGVLAYLNIGMGIYEKINLLF